MLPTAIKRKLTLPLMGALLMGLSVLLTTYPHTAFAQTSSPAASPVTLKRVFSAGANGQENSTFARGDAIRFVVDIDNSSGQQMQVVLAVVSAGPTGQIDHKTIYADGKYITLPPGPSTWSFPPTDTAPSTIPKDVAGGTYVVVAAVDSNLDSKIESKAVGTFTITPGG